MCCAPLTRVNTVGPPPLHGTRQDSGLGTITENIRLAERYRHNTCVVLTIQKGGKKNCTA